MTHLTWILDRSNPPFPKGGKWPDGNYTISITGTDASGQAVSIPSEVEGVVDAVDLTKTPPLLAIGSQTFTLDKIKRVVRHGT